MMDHPIALSIPSKIEWLGFCYHGLFLVPLNSDVVYQLSDVEIITRGGRRIKPATSDDATSQRYYYHRTLPRPVLYMHPLASHAPEEESGLDRSGYCIFYLGPDRFPAFLRAAGTITQLAYTPDSEGQAIAFTSEDGYQRQLRIGRPTDREGYISIPRVPGRRLLSASIDGRLRVKGSFPSIAEIFNMRLWYNNSDLRPLMLNLGAYSLAGERGAIVATPAEILQPTCEFVEDSQRTVGETIAQVKIWVPYVGMCVDPASFTPSVEVSYSPSYDRPAYSRSYEKMTSDIDVCADALSPSFLSCSIELERVMTNHGSGDGDAAASWGEEQCHAPNPESRLCTGNTWFRETSHTGSLLERETITLSGWGGSSSAGAVYEFEATEGLAVTGLNDVEVSRIETRNYNSSILVQLEGQTMLSKENWPSVSNSYGLRYDLPRALEGAESDVRLRFPHCDHEKGVIESGVNFASAGLYKMSLSADGVHAIACLVTEGTVVYSPEAGFFLDPATMQQRLTIGRIFGFGISVPGRELTPEEMDSRLFIAYDPLEKKFSDIYTHPVYFQ